MRQIVKLALNETVQNQLAQKQENINNGSAQPNWRLTPTQRIEITDKLLKSQRYLCCYCECIINASNCHIEHFYERSDRDDLRYDYRNNLLLSCEGDRQKQQEPETEEEKEERIANISCGHNKGKTYHNNLRVAYELLLNPINNNSTLMRYKDSGLIMCKTETLLDIEKVDYTVQRLNLNSQKLKNKRLDKIEEINNQIIDKKMNLKQQKQYIATLLTTMKKIIIQGIKFDEKSSYQKGPKLAPPLIREALNCGSANMFAENLISIENSNIVDKGDFEITEYFDIEKITEAHLDLDTKIFTLGGDHSITFPIIKAHSKKYPKLDILHIDAHCDLYDDFEGDKFSHACPFARIMENKLATRLVQVGIRTLNTHQAEQANKFKVEIHQMKALDLSKIPKFENPLYISLDLDGDFQNMTAFLAAKMMKEILSKMML